MMASNGGFIYKGSVFSHDGRLLLSPSGSQLKLLSTLTGELAGVLEGHDADITTVALNPNQRSQVYSASKDGTIKLWDYVSSECIKTFPIRETIRSMVFSGDRPVVYLSIDWKDGTSGRVISYDLSKGKAGQTAMRTSASKPLSCNGTSSGSSRAQTFVATFDKHSLFVWRVGEAVHQPLNLHHTKPYTCVAISADESMIAAGDVSGRIQIWRNFGAHVPAIVCREGQNAYLRHQADPAQLRPTTMHWHASAVGCLTFSPDGTYLLSGGREGVLVLWQVETGGQNFLPRLGGPLVGLLPSPTDPARYLISQMDNTLRIVNTAVMKVESSIFGVRPLPAGMQPQSAHAASLFQPGTGHLMVPSENAEMQLFDTVQNRHISLVKIINRNYVSMQERGSTTQAPGFTPAMPFVSHAIMTASGSCLFTVDVRPDAGVYGSPQCCLKFWDLANASTRTGLLAPFTLNTRVDDPHAPGQISSLCCHPSADVAVTTGASDCEFRVWVRAASQRKPGGKAVDPSSWRCSYKGLSMTASAFSPDGSVLAVAAGSKVTLWDPESCRLATVLSLAPEHQALGLPLTKLAFVRGSPYLVGCSDGFLAVWNLLTATLQWALDVPISALAVDPVHARFAVAVPSLEQQRGPEPKPSRAPPPSSGQAGAATTDAPTGAGSSEAAAPGALPSWVRPGCGLVSSQSWQPAPKQKSHVLIFDPRSPAPRYHCVCPGTLSPTLLYVLPGMPQHAEAGGVLPGEVSPLMVLAENRTYSYVTSRGQNQAEEGTSSQRPDGQPQMSAFEAAFGVLEVPQQQQTLGMDIDADLTRPRWQQLFDAPSHTLPAPTALAQAFLRLVTTE